MKITQNEILEMETRYRASLINSLGGFKSVVLISTVSKNNQPNLAIFNSLFHLGANPALCGFIVRPDVSPRHTLSNILETKYFTINHLNEEIYVNAHQSSARFDETVSEYDACQLTPQAIENQQVTYVKESRVKFLCEFQQKVDVEINGTIMVIGLIKEIILPEGVVMPDGFIDLEQADTITCSGLDSYHKTMKLGRLTYAKPNTWPQKIE